MWHDYYNVNSVTEALQLLAQYPARARIVAGGTDIMLEMERGQRPDIDVLIDITRIPDLDRIVVRDDVAYIGAMVSHNQVVANPVMIERALPLGLVARIMWYLVQKLQLEEQQRQGVGMHGIVGVCADRPVDGIADDCEVRGQQEQRCGERRKPFFHLTKIHGLFYSK